MQAKECSVKVKLILYSQFSDNIDMEFQENVYQMFENPMQMTYGDRYGGTER